MYALIYTPSFDRAYANLPVSIQSKVDQQILRLCENPHHPSLHTHKRKDHSNLWQALMTRNYRLYFLLEGQSITLISVGPHEK
jgi:mRNA-degrading endonuclease RelE of RelBE toxin-antitoxin system